MTPTGRDCSELPPAWAAALEGHFATSEATSLVEACYAECPDEVFPDQADVFRAFHLTPPSEVRVVIIGQDPYPTRGQAHGLAFSAPKVELPRSLKAVFSNLAHDTDLDEPFVPPATGDLTKWAEQGVLLLNTALTVRDGNAGSHLRRWREFTAAVLCAIVEKQESVVFMLWGEHAFKATRGVSIPDPPHRVIRMAHPTPRGRTKQRRFNDPAARPFSEANSFLKTDRIDWTLP